MTIVSVCVCCGRFARDSTLALHQLTRKVSGMVDAAVMGGIVNYEKVSVV